MSTQHASRIPIGANKGVTGALFGVAVITSLGRTYIRVRILKQWGIEDGLLAFAVVCLCGTTTLNYLTVDYIYNALNVILLGAGNSLGGLLAQIPLMMKETDAAAGLWWLVIFSVKLAYLFFFRRLIFGLQALSRWWWCVMVFMVPAFVACFTISILSCPSTTTIGVLTQCSGLSAAKRHIAVTTTTTVFDIITDIMVLTFPIAIVWKVRLNLRRKFGLGTTLCLSIVMIIIAVIRISGIRLEGGEVDIVWLAFWQQQECSIAIIMVSLTAFRSLFIADAQARRPRYTPSTWRERMVWNRHHRDSGRSGNGAMGELPQIPSVTMTGLRTMIWGSQGLTTVDEPGTEQLARPMEARPALRNQGFPVEHRYES